MERAGEYVPSTTYFDEREARIKREIDVALSEIEAARGRFAGLVRDLSSKRDEVLLAVATLRGMRESLAEQSRLARQEVEKGTALVAQCDVLVADLDQLLTPSREQVAQLDAQIADLEGQQQRKTAKPAKTVEQLEARLVRLRVRRALAEKSAQIESTAER